jgi:hypothetical protein
LGAAIFSFRLHLEAIQPVNRVWFDVAENQACVVAVVIEPHFRQINAEVGESGFGEVVAEFRFFAPAGFEFKLVGLAFSMDLPFS